MKSFIPLTVATALLIVGCGKKDEARSDAPRSPPVQQQDSKTPVTPTPPPPSPDAPKGAVAPAPQPGQAGDHSSPAFKAGGVQDKK